MKNRSNTPIDTKNGPTVARTGTARRGTRLARLLAAVIAIALVAAACGGGDDDVSAGSGGGDGGSASDGGSTSGSTTSSVPVTVECPSAQAMFELMNRATFQVFGEFVVAGEADLQYFPIGTAWAVDDRVLVTNGHVAEAFEDAAESGLQLSRAVAVQAGTGEVVELLRALVHPDYSGDPLGSPDVALFTSKEALPTALTLAPANVVVEPGDEILLSGFPGDVEDAIVAIPGLTVPQATSLTGRVSALRSYDITAVVGEDNLDVIQHQAPTTPGTSGSPIVHCDSVVAANNAGTVRVVFSVNENGEQVLERQSPAANNFGVHVRHIHALMELFEDNAIQGFELPVAAAAPAAGGGPAGDPMTDGAAEAIVLAGSVDDPAAAHSFAFQINPDGSIEGLSEWSETGQFTLVGQVNPDGTVVFVDDAPERLGFRRGTYEGVITSETTIEGVYYEQGQEANQFPWVATIA